MPEAAALVLGTVQLGLPYGIANRGGMPTEAAAVALVREAVERGVRLFDTARAYGDSEKRLGLALADRPDVEITTKLDPLAGLPADASVPEAAAAARASVEASRKNLGRDRLDALLLHRAFHRSAWGGAVWETLGGLRERGAIGRLGVSVQAPSEALEALGDPLVGQIQLPFNLLDRRWHAGGVFDALRQRPDVTLHARSVFLQGLLASSEARLWPAVEGVDAARLCRRIADVGQRLRRGGPADLALAFVRAEPRIGGIVIGMDNTAQLVSNLELWHRSPLTAAEAADAARSFPDCPDALLDPARWPRTDTRT